VENLPGSLSSPERISPNAPDLVHGLELCD
jgi:hypothetical protein